MLMKMRSKMQKANNQKGFTLVELMVVVVILGVLVAIAVPIYNNVSADAKTKACLSNMRIIVGAGESFKAASATNAYPADIAALVSGGYLKSAPICKEGTTAYTYTQATNTVVCPNVGTHATHVLP